MGISQSLPWFVDSVLCVGVLLHGICDSKPEFNFFLFPLPGIRGWEINLSFAYLLAGYFSFISGLALAPYRTFYPMAAIGFISCAFRIIEKKSREKGEMYHRHRKHSHKHWKKFSCKQWFFKQNPLLYNVATCRMFSEIVLIEHGFGATILRISFITCWMCNMPQFWGFQVVLIVWSGFYAI